METSKVSSTADNGESKIEYETCCYCCQIEKPGQVISVDAEKAINNIKQDELVYQNLDVFITTLDKCNREDINIINDYGLITATNTTRKSFGGGNALTSVAVSSEAARGLAIAKLRSKVILL